MKNSEKTLDMIVNLCKSRGFVYAGSEIYGGLANAWDYGPLGVEFKNNVKKAWLKKFVQESDYNVGLDAAILMNPTTWVTTGHVGNFSDPLVDCKGCGSRQRADKGSVCAFPEGYTRKDGKLHPFRSGVFKIAQKTNVPIVVCTIRGTREIFKNLKHFRHTDVDFHLVEVIAPESYAGMNTVELGEMIYEKMIGDLGEEFRFIPPDSGLPS